MVLRDLARQQVRHLGRDTKAAEIDGRNVEDAAHRNGEVLLAHVGFFDDELDEARAFPFLLFEQFFDLLGREQTVLDEGVGDAFTK